jgi:hypothetical protein
MSKPCTHPDLEIHSFVELQVPYSLKHGMIVSNGIDDTPVIRPDMGATCPQCAFAMHYQDWRTTSDDLRTLFARVRKDMQEANGYIEGYPLQAEAKEDRHSQAPEATPVSEGEAPGEKEGTALPYDLPCSLLIAQCVQAQPYRCWRNAALAVLLLPELFADGGSYVEGWIMLPKEQSIVIAEHGWCQLADGRIIDPSILLVERADQPIAYFPGLILSWEQVCQQVPGSRLPLSSLLADRSDGMQHEDYQQAYEQAWKFARLQAAKAALPETAIHCLRHGGVVHHTMVLRR